MIIVCGVAALLNVALTFDVDVAFDVATTFDVAFDVAAATLDVDFRE
jgi:hypothetical protein